MPSIPYLKKKIGSSYLVWFKNSDSYLQMEEPAWFVFRKTTQRYKPGTIAEEFAIRYGIPPEESLRFVKDIRLEIDKMNQVNKAPNRLEHLPPGLSDFTFQPYSLRRYQIGGQWLDFSFQTRNFEYYIHPLIGHFETTETNERAAHFELFAFADKIVFRLNGEVKGLWTTDETHLVKGQLFMEMINHLHGKTNADWLMTVHASAITNGEKTILFSAPPNHGKTTMAALLQDRGYKLISDDFVPIDRHSLKAYPLPIAMSVKQTSMEVVGSLLPGLEEKPLNYISPEKSVRYHAPKLQTDFTADVLPVHAFVFIHYHPSVDFNWEKLDAVRAMKFLLDQSWILPNEGNAEILFERITRLSFYHLTYSNNEKAMEAITQLFDHD